MMRILFVILILLISCKSANIVKPDQKINQEFKFELSGYLGKWYEIARFNHIFERGLEGVTATYSLRKDGKIKVVNQGFLKGPDGKKKIAIGKAKTVSSEMPRNLKVSFFLNFYAAYNILEIDSNYTYVLIGSNSPDYLWILSRTPQMDPAIYNSLINKAKLRGYDVSKLIKVKQPLN